MPSPVGSDVGVIVSVGAPLGSDGGGVGTGAVGCVEGRVVTPGAVDGVRRGLRGVLLLPGVLV